MHILVIPSWYYTLYSQQKGIFFKDQAVTLSKHVDKVSIIAPVLVSIKELKLSKLFHFKQKVIEKDNVMEIIKPILAIPFLGNINRRIQFYIGKKMLKQYVKDHGLPDVVHLQSALSGMLAIWFKNHYGVPFVVTEHWSGFLRNKATKSEKLLARKVFENSTKNIAVSSYFAAKLEKQTNSSFEVIPNVVDVDFFKIGKNKFDTFTFLQVANLNRNKNQEMLIRAFSSFIKHNNANLIILGAGNKKESLESLITEYSLQKQVTLYGLASRDVVKEHMQKSHSLIISSYVETFGVVAIEAMSCGIPVISTQCGGPEEIIKNYNGILCDCTEEALLDSMIQCYNSTWDSTEIRSNIELKYSSNKVAVKILELMSF